MTEIHIYAIMVQLLIIACMFIVRHRRTTTRRIAQSIHDHKRHLHALCRTLQPTVIMCEVHMLLCDLKLASLCATRSAIDNQHPLKDRETHIYTYVFLTALLRNQPRLFSIYSASTRSILEQIGAFIDREFNIANHTLCFVHGHTADIEIIMFYYRMRILTGDKSLLAGLTMILNRLLPQCSPQTVALVERDMAGLTDSCHPDNSACTPLRSMIHRSSRHHRRTR